MPAARQTPRSVARWIVNELVALAPDGRVEALPLGGGAFGRAVALIDSGRIAPAAAKKLLASLAERPGEPAERVAELGLAKLDDRSALEEAVTRALDARSAEVARYRAGEAKLLGFLLGAAMRETQGAADAALVRAIVLARLTAEGA